MSSGAPRLPHSLGPKTCLGHAIVLVGKVGLEARRLSVEGLPPLYRSAEISTMIPLNGSDTNGSLLLAAEHYGDYESGMGGASRTLVVLRTRGDRTTEGRVGNSMVKAQRGALLMAIAPVRDCAYSSLDVHTLKRALQGSARSPVPMLKSVVRSPASLSTNPTSSHLNPTRTHQYLSNSPSKRNVFVPHYHSRLLPMWRGSNGCLV